MPAGASIALAPSTARTLPGGAGERLRYTPDHPAGVIRRDPRRKDAVGMAEEASPEELARLREEVEQLRAESAKRRRHAAWGVRLRRAALVFLLVLGCGLAGMSAIAVWTRATVLDTDRYVSTMAPIARSPAVQDAVGDKLDARISGAIDFDALARQVTPRDADLLAPAISAGLQSVIRSRIDAFVHGPRFPALWDRVNLRAHETVVGLLTTGRAGRLELEDDTVYLDMSAVVDRVKQDLEERGLTRVADAIPPTVDGRVTLLTSEGFAKGRDAIDLLESLTIALPILSLACLIGHVLLSESRRRGVLRVALGLACTALLLLAVVGIGRSLYLDAIDATVLPREAASDIFDALIVLLRDGLRIAVLAALVLAALSLLAGAPLRRAAAATGPRVRAVAGRVAADPRTAWISEHRTSAQWGVVVLGALVLVAWDNPTAGVVLIDAALMAVAIALVAALARSGRRPAT
jgi:hypothetical protein